MHNQMLCPEAMKEVNVRILRTPTEEEWNLCKEITLGTIGKTTITPIDGEFKKKIILSEHSTIRPLNVIWEWENLPSWVSVHFVRHHVGCTPFVQTQRNDRQKKYDRCKAPQDAPVLHRETANFQSIMDISKLRLCLGAAPETRYAWQLFLSELAKYEPELVMACVPKCVYRGGLCTEPFATHGKCCPKDILTLYTRWLKED